MLTPNQELLKNASSNGDEMLLNGKAPLPGQVIQLPNLAKTFKELVAHGKDGFYKGRIAQAIVDLVKSKGGLMELEDLGQHETTFVEPIKYTYAKDVTVYEVKFPVLEIKGILKFCTCSVLQTARVLRLCWLLEY